MKSCQRAASALKRVLSDSYADCRLWLDVGAGDGAHAAVMRSNGREVTTLDYAQNERGTIDIVGDFANIASTLGAFDGVWCSHTLEHQLNVNSFLRSVGDCLKEGGALAVTVPPVKPQIVGGHVTLWNAGLLLYNLVLAGFDCRDAAVLSEGYDVSVVVRKRTAALPRLRFDRGDIETLAPFFPIAVYQGFDGRIEACRWPTEQRAGGASH